MAELVYYSVTKGDSQCTKFAGHISAFENIAANVIGIQGSAIASFVITAADLPPNHHHNASIVCQHDAL